MSATHVESVLPALSFLLRRNSRGHLVTGAILTTVSLLTVGLSVAVP
jgi:hypothetical protein